MYSSREAKTPVGSQKEDLYQISASALDYAVRISHVTWPTLRDSGVTQLNATTQTPVS